MASVVVNGDTSGAVTLSAPAVAGTVTVTLPAASGTMLTTASTGVVTQAMLSTNVAGNGPAFSAVSNALQSVSAGTTTKVLFATEEFDTNSNFASSTFTPTVAGYYYLTYQIRNDGGVTSNNWAWFYKNGAQYIRATEQGSNYVIQFQASLLLYLNGSTDYVEIYYFSNTSASIGNADSKFANRFSGFLARAA